MNLSPSSLTLGPLWLALASAALLIVAFPPFNQPWCAWIALVPWLLLLRRAPGRAAFWWSFLIGVLFFLGSIWWLTYATVAGWVALCTVLALVHFALFGVLAHQVSGPWRVDRGRERRWVAPLLVPTIWVSLEYVRSHLFSGFGWNLLAYSQAPWIAAIQMADIAGCWGVSFLVVLVNAALAQALDRTATSRQRVGAVGFAGACLLAAVGYGAWRLPQGSTPLQGQGTVRIALVQGNIPQEQKWRLGSETFILSKYRTLTKEASASNPDLVVWPETAVPGFLGVDERLTRRVGALARAIGRPLLVGSPMASLTGAQAVSTNSAALIDASGAIVQRYDKIHLVPFGEFIPFERWFPWLRNRLPPMIGDFVAGRHFTIFDVPITNHQAPSTRHPSPVVAQRPPPFSVLICFEDIFPSLARRFVRDGARMLLVITNDAWFGPTAAAYQHAQASTFRAIELRVPVARAANTGWSGCIDPSGRWIASVRDGTGRELFVSGHSTCELPLGTTRTLSLRWGDWFSVLCVAATVVWWCSHLLATLRRRSGPFVSATPY